MSTSNQRTAPFHELASRLDGTLHTDPIHRVLFSTDASIFQVDPVAVVFPASTNDVTETVNFARRHGLPIHPRGAGSGVCGAALGSGIVLDFTRHMNRLLHLDREAKTFECEPGYRLGELEAVLDGSGLFFPPDPSTGEYATFGGMTGTNASGSHSVKYGNTADYLTDAEMVMGDGSRIRFSEIAALPPDRLPASLKALADLYRSHSETIEAAYPEMPFNTAGYNLRGLVRDGRLDLRRLIAGAEGTLGIITRLTFRLADRPSHDSLVVAYMDDIVSSARAVQAILPMGPSGIEIMDKSLIELARENDASLKDTLPTGVDNVLMVEFDAFDPEACAGQAAAVIDLLVKGGFTARAYPAVSAAEKKRFWAVRKAAVPILNRLKGPKKIVALIEDAVVPIRNLVGYFEGIYELLDRHEVRFVTYGHIAKGLMHTRPLLDLKDPGDVRRLRIIADDFYEMVRALDGTVSGEHGDGRLRSAYVRRRYPAIYPLFQRAKQLMDPFSLFNPDIITCHDPDQMTKDLRYGEDYRRLGPPAAYHLSWPEGFENEAEKCHGCSKCTTMTHATRMCPVYKLTREEAATPKAKANALRALISGRLTGPDAFEAVFREVLSRCILCGSCAWECPSGVNIPKLAMEARARYVERFGNPAADHILTRLEESARLARRLTPLAAPLLGLTAARRLVERATGISALRRPVAPALRSLADLARRADRSAKPAEKAGPKVLYFAGCYAGYVVPSIGLAAIRLLKHMGVEVLLPDQNCCGLPLLSKGMAGRASDKIKGNLVRWGRMLASVDAVVVTCSSCGHALSEEWESLAGRSASIDLLKSKLLHISSFVNRHADRLNLRPTGLKLAYHSPCHLRIQPDPESSITLLRRIEGADVQPLKSHCCGMAGSWGMTADHFELSRRIAGDLIGTIDRSGADWAVTDCPTCRMQIEQFSPVPVRHPVEIVADCLVRP
ncbi:MAG: FAD-binding and (Fe-S)-binding domain-containing protein [Desulfobacterales bacterium]